LADLAGKPLIVRVRENLALLAADGARIVVATDHDDVRRVVDQAGFESMMTLETHPSGTDRCYEVAQAYKLPMILNVQGDEPFVRCEDLRTLMTAMTRQPPCPMGTLAFPMTEDHDYLNPNVVKVVRSHSGQALYFSRSPIPFDRDPKTGLRHKFPVTWQHLGIYAFSFAGLKHFCALPASHLEQVEKLEQLRAIEYGMPVLVEVARHRTVGIDTAEDLTAANAIFAKGLGR